MKRMIACLLSVIMLAGFIPVEGIIAFAAEHVAFSIDNVFIRVQFSK